MGMKDEKHQSRSDKKHLSKKEKGNKIKTEKERKNRSHLRIGIPKGRDWGTRGR